MSSLIEFETQLSEPIYEPSVQRVFAAFKDLGCLEQEYQLISSLPEQVALVFVPVLKTQVNREKAVWPVYIAQKMGWKEEDAIKIGAATDIIWSLSVIVDDMFDHDSKRAGDDSLWSRVGQEQARKLAFEVFGECMKYLSRIDPSIKDLALFFVQKGIDSVVAHKGLGLDADPNVILANYRDRDDFHSAFPIYTLARTNRADDAADEIVLGLRLFNQAGQLVNDLRDIVPRAGLPRLSDLREGRISVALKCLYDQADSTDQKLIRSLFGAGQVGVTDCFEITRLAASYRFREQMSRRIVDTYSRSSNILTRFLTPEGTALLCDWQAYKTRICHELIP